MYPLVAISGVTSATQNLYSIRGRSTKSSMSSTSARPRSKCDIASRLDDRWVDALSRLQPIGDGLVVQFGLGEMAGDDLGLGFGDIAELFGDHMGDPRVIGAPRHLQKRLVGDVLQQGMLELIGGVGAELNGQDDFGRGQSGDCRIDRQPVPRSRGRQELDGENTP